MGSMALMSLGPSFEKGTLSGTFAAEDCDSYLFGIVILEAGSTPGKAVKNLNAPVSRIELDGKSAGKNTKIRYFNDVRVINQWSSNFFIMKNCYIATAKGYQ